MKSFDLVRRAARSLRNSKARTILTSLAIAVGAFTLTLSIAAGEGARQYADTLIGSNINPRVVFVVKDKTLFNSGGTNARSGLRVYDVDTGTTGTGVTIKQMTQADVENLIKRGDLEYIVPVYNIQAKFLQFAGSDIKFTSELGTYDATIKGQTSFGTLPALGEQLADNEVVMPESFADTLVEQKVISAKSELVGKEVTLTIARPGKQPTQEEILAAFQSGGEAAVANLSAPETKELTYVVRGLTTQSATSLTSSTAVQLPASQAKLIAEFATEGTDSFQKYLGVTALAKEGYDPATIKNDLKAQDFGVQTAEDLQSLIFTIVNILQGIVAGFGVIALIASVFGIINTQYISVLERTREIGLMKALGMRGRHVSRLFQFEAAWIGFLGGVIGAGLAYSVGTLMNPWVTETLALGEGNYLLIFQTLPIVGLIVALMIVAMVAGWFPAHKAAKLDPIEALRTE